MASVRTATGPSELAGCEPPTGLPESLRRAGAADPLYPEPTGHRGWIAEQPLPWLGVGLGREPGRSLSDLVTDGVMSVDAAALLTALAQHRASVLVIADRSGAGKSTLLEALLSRYPATDRRIRLRGSFETFNWEGDPRFDPCRALLIAEEISGHLPTYLWGAPVGRFLGWRGRGCALAATAHADSLEDVARLLTGYPLRLPLTAVAAFDAVLRLGPGHGGPSQPFVLTDAWSSGVTSGGGLTRSTLLDREGPRTRAVADLLRRLGDTDPLKGQGASTRSRPPDRS